MIDANIRTLGFDTADIELILSSHTHFDHVGGIAALQRASGATVAASASSAAALRTGWPTRDDPQAAYESNNFPVVAEVRVIGDREELPCDILLSPHPGFFAMESQLRRRRDGVADAFVDATACRRYAADAAVRLERRIADETAAR